MKYLFVVQGEGRGHLTQAIALAQILRRHGHQVIEAMVGKSSGRVLPDFFEQKIECPVATFDSPAIDYGKGGKRGNIGKSILINTTPRKLARWQKSISTIVGRVDACRPDVVVNFYEMLTGIASITHRLKVPVVGIAHQFLIDHPDYAHRSKTDQGQFLLRLDNMLCSLGSTKTLALSLYPLNDNPRDRMAVVPPLLRKEVFELRPRDDGHILTYLLNPAYADELHAWHRTNPNRKVEVFWDKKDAPDTLSESGLTFHRIDDAKFLRLMETCRAYATTAGFESVCEAMYLGKPAMMIPAHVEQEINAEDAASVGAGIVASDFDLSPLLEFTDRYSADTAAFRAWVDSAEELYIRHLTAPV